MTTTTMPAKVQVEQTGVFLQKPDFEAAEAAFYASGGKPVKVGNQLWEEGRK